MADRAFVKVGALWIKDGKKGKYMTGGLGDAQLYVFKNEKKTAGSNQPDYYLFLGDGNRDRKGSGQARQDQAPARDDSDVPF